MKKTIQHLADCPLDELIKTLNTFYPRDWDGSHPNLKHYIPLLNRIDSIYEKHINKYKLNENYILPLDVPHHEVEVMTTCINYSNQLLEYSTSRDIYNSHSYMADLMFSNSIDIKISALKLICCLSEKFAAHFPMKFSLSKKHKDLIIDFIKVFPPQSIRTTPGPTPIDVKNYDQSCSPTVSPPITTEQVINSQPFNKKQKKTKNKDSNKDVIHINLNDCMRSEFVVPSSWKILTYEYFKTGSVVKKKNRSKDKNKTENDESGEGLRTFKLNSEALKKLSLQQIFDKAANVIPKEKWSDFVLHVYIAMAYSGKSFECLALRGKLVTFKCIAIAAAASNITYNNFVGLIFDEEPYLLSYMCDLINPDNHVAREPCIATLRAFVNISNRKSGASDLMRALGGNVSHGLLFHILKTIYKQTKENNFNNDQIYMNYIYNILANLLENKTLAIHLRSAGLMKIFLDFLSLRNNYRMTRSGPLHLIEIFIERLDDAFDEFLAHDGFNVIISLLEYEVQFAIDNPNYEGGAPKYSNLSYVITARQVKLINFLLKLVISLITTYPGDRMRNLYESPMLKSIIKIFENPKIFGYELLYDSVHIMTTILNTEPTAYSILNESGIIDTFFDKFDSLLLPDNNLLLELPDAINALSLNNGGLLKVKETFVIRKLFSIFKDPKICKQLVIIENVMSFGHAIDELARHHPELKGYIDEEILYLIDTIPSIVKFNAIDFYQSSNGSLYHNMKEKNVHTEPNSTSLERWETSSDATIIQCSLIFLASIFENSKDWRRLFGQINMKNLFKFVTLKNAPFDYSLSKTIIHFRNIIKWIDQTTHSYCLPFLKECIENTLKELHDFIYYPNDSVSFFAQFDKFGNLSETSRIAVQNIISNLGIMNCLLFVLSDFYSKLHKYQPSKILDIIEVFGSDSGLQLINDLCLFYRRLALEEVLLHLHTPPKVAENAFTLVQSISPKQEEIGVPPTGECDWNGNSAKFKNISILYFNFSRSKFWLRNVFNSFCSINYGRRVESKTLIGVAARLAVGIITKYTDTMMSQLFNINTKKDQIKCGYIFCILNQLYLNMFSSFGSAAPVNPTMSVCLLQNKQFPMLKDLTIEMFTLLGSLDQEMVEKAEHNTYVSIKLESLVLAVLQQIFNIISDIGTVNVLGSISNGDKLYSYLGRQTSSYCHEALLSVKVQAAIASYVLIHELVFIEEMDVLSNFPFKLPQSLIDGIIALSDVAFTNFKSQHMKFKGKLFPISAETTSPSDYNIKFLVDLGVSEEDAKEILVFYNNDVELLLSESPDALKENFGEKDIDWERILNAKYSPLTIEPIHLNFSPKYDIETVDDLYFNISTREQAFISHWIDIAQLYPDSIPIVSNLLVSIFDKASSNSMRDVLNMFVQMINQMDFENDDDEANKLMTSTLSLIGLVLSNLSYSSYFGIIENIATTLASSVTEDSIKKPWFPSLLLIFTKIYSETKIPFSPSIPTLLPVNKYPVFSTPTYADIPCLNPTIEKALLELVLSTDTIESEKQLIEVTNIILLLCNTAETVNKLANSKVLNSLVVYIKQNKCSEQVHSHVVNVIRRSVECDKIIKDYFEREITMSLHTKLGSKKAKVKELHTFLEENYALVLRHPDLFVEVVSEYCILKQTNRSHDSPLVRKLTDEDKEILGKFGYDLKQKKSYASTNSSKIMQFLLSELMDISRKDMMMNLKNEKKSKASLAENTREIIKNNRSLEYAVFLLETVGELMFSYASCKNEFLTFSKKLKEKSDKKPRSTAINMLIHKFITVNPFEKEENEIHNVHELLSSLGCVCILGLITTVPKEDVSLGNNKAIDDDVLFARKFTVDVLIKILKDAESSNKNSIIKYGRIVDIVNLIRKLCGESVGNIIGYAVDCEANKHDRYYFAKELLDKKFGVLATGILSRLDMNFPYTEQVSDSILKLLSLLGEIKVQYQIEFKADQHTADADEEVYDDDLEEREDAPDLLRNSTLGMYDLDDIEDEDDDDFDDEFDDQFLVDDGIEIILSDNDGSEVEVIDELNDSSIDVGDNNEDGSEIGEDENIDEDDDVLMDVDDDVNLSDIRHQMRDNQIDFVYESDYDDEHDDVDDDLIYEHGFNNEDSDDNATPEDFYSDEDMSEGDEDDNDIIELDVDEMDADDDTGSESDDSAILQEWLEEFENEERQNPPRSRRGSSIRHQGANNDERPFPSRILFPQLTSSIPFPSESSNNHTASSFMEFTQSLLDRRSTQLQGLLDMRSVFEPLMFPKKGFSNFFTLKSTIQRWKEVSQLYPDKIGLSRVIPAIFKNLHQKSEVLENEYKRISEEKVQKMREKREKELQKKKEVEEARLREMETETQNAPVTEDPVNEQPIEPIFVDIGGTNVDISRTGIDPEFLLALPDDMRQEVYEQHVNQSRFEERGRQASHFIRNLSLGPNGLRIDLIGNPENNEDEDDDDLAHEVDFDDVNYYNEDEDDNNFHNFSNEHDDDDEDDNVDDDDDDSDDDINDDIFGSHLPVQMQRSQNSNNTLTIGDRSETASNKKSSKIYFTALIDKPSIAGLLKLLFVPQVYYKRELFFKTVAFLCLSKHTRSEVIAIILYILREGIKDQNSLSNVYSQVCTRASKDSSSEQYPKFNTNFICPANCTIISLATQCIDVIQYLLENEGSMRFHFLTDQESQPFVNKTFKKTKLKDNTNKFPINSLLNLLENRIIKEDSNLMDILSRSIQIATRPLPTMKTKLSELDKKESEQYKKVPQLPNIPDRSLRQIINILVADECANKVFQQTIISIQNLSVLENARVVFPKELSKKATHLSSKIVKELRELVNDLRKDKKDIEDLPSLGQFSSGASDQAKLLRILTALDYLYQSRDNDADGIEELKLLYKNSALGPLWGALSDCLKLLREDDNMNYIAFILSPLIEALMVVCKHSKVQRMNALDVLKYEERKELDFAKEPVESLFFTFTEEHKKILNHMIRSNPKLMSGPFQVLIRNPKVLEFDNKRVYFDQKLHDKNTLETREKLPIKIRRSQVFLDSYRNIFFKPSDKIKKSILDIHFNGEEGVDAGGVTREWYQVLSRQIFDPNYALFIPVASDKTTFHPNRTSWVNPEHLSFFKFVGMIIGKAVYDGYVLDCHFSRAVFKSILNKTVSLKDMESLDLDYYKSLIWMLENDITDIIVETFSVETDDYGEHKIIDLIPNGRDISVTEENKQEYVRLIVEYRLITSVKEQMDNFLEGFYSMIPKELIVIFDEQELELLVSGLPDIDVEDWKNNSIYENYSPSSQQVQWFWRAVKSFDAEERAKLLQFVTGTSKVPLNGFKELSGMNGVSKFSIHRVYNSTDRLPTAHTCFNQIDLPEYESYSKLRNALLLAIREGHEGFGFA